RVSLLRVVGIDGESVLLKVEGGRIKYARGDETPIHIFKTSVDSVPWYSPVIIKENDLVHIIPIEELWERVPGPIFVTEKGEEVKFVSGIRAYSSRRNPLWSEVKAIVRHKWKGSLIRIETGDSVVDVSPNHSIYKKQGSAFKLVSAEEVEVGDIVLEVDFVKPKVKRHVFVGTEDLAWLLGLFLADGCASCTKARNKFGYEYDQCYTIISNTNDEILKRAIAIFEENFHKRMFIDNKGTPEQSARCQSRDIYRYFAERFYTVGGLKKVPVEILNTPSNRIARAFLEGYYAGDGHKYPSTAVTFDSNSWALAQGILWLNSTRTWRVNCREDKPNIVHIELHAEQKMNPRGRYGPRREKGEVKKVWRVPYEGYMYDLVTSKGNFVTGVGGIVVHNTFLDIVSGDEDLRDAMTKGHFIIENASTGTIDLVEMERWAKAFSRLRGLVTKYMGGR
ncbi:MAG: hypothetical protein QXZ56_07560, partial [Sulfolobales archaeon]